MYDIFLVSQTLLGTGIQEVLKRAPDCALQVVTNTNPEVIASLLLQRADSTALRHDVSILDGTCMNVLAFLERLGKNVTAHLGPIIVILPRPPDEETFFFLMKWGCFACLTAQVPGEEFLSTVRKVGRGECLLTSEILAIPAPSLRPQVKQVLRDMEPMIQQPANPLTPREQEVLLLVANGKTNKEVGRALEMSAQTVKNHLTSILKKLECRTRTEAVCKAINRQWIWLLDFPRPHQQPRTAVA